MKRFNIIFFNLFLYLFLFSFINISGFAQNTDWKIQYEPAKVFIENKGQFHIYGSEEPVLFAYDNSSSVIYFTKKGITYSFIKRWRAEKREKKREMKITSVEEWKMKELEVTAMDHVTDVVEMQWENANPDVEIIALEETPDYYSYSLKGSGDKDLNINFIKAFKKIIYKNLYPNVDVEYIFHPEDGIKYSVVLHPGADLSKIKMNYSKQPTVIDNEIHIPTLFGDIIDHAPLTFYENNHSEIITSHFNLDGSTVSFFTYPYNMSRKVIIDPWTQTPSLPNSNGVWETERDGAGNVYIIGGCMPMKLLKYNASGTLLWTYITPYDTANNWLGTFATDLAGNSFVTSGSIAKLQKISTTGSLLWNSPMPLFNTDEYWNIAFNCDQTKLIIGGTTGSMIDLYGAIFDINTSSGAVLNTQIVGSNFMWAIPPIIEEVRSITSSRNARYYFLTLDTIGAIDDDFSACGSTSPIIFRHNSGYNLAYKCETYRPNNGNSGIMSIRANRYFVYTQNGTHIQKRSLIDGAVITEASIPGGLSTASLGRNQVGNSGIDIDECGNVYVGSGNAIVKYDADLNLITSIPTSYKVSDVTVTDGGNVFYCGTTGDYNTVNRTGYLQYSNMSTCDPMTLFCCDANICPVGPLCDTDSPVTLEVSSSGGSWSGTGVSAGGVFDPAAAGIGTHTITYTLPCGESAVEITVIGCAPLYVCAEGNGDITVSAGFGPYTWSEYLPASTTPITNQAECQACGYTWMPFVNQCMNGIIPVTECASPAGYYTFATGNTVTPTGNYPIQVVDIYGNSYTITDYSLLPDCGACPTLNIMATNIVNVCAGETNGSFSVSTSGGNSPYDYTLLDGGGNTVATYINISGAQDFTGLGAGTYTLNVMDNISCPGSITITISEVSSPTPVITGPTSFCSGSSATLNAGSGYTSYNWSTGATTQSITVTTGETYSVTVYIGSGCSGSTSVTITENASPTPSISGELSFCPGSSTSLDAGSGYASYLWSTSETSQSIIVNTAGIYSVTVTDNIECTGATNVQVVMTQSIPVDVSASPQTVCPGSPSTLTAAGGDTYEWSTTPPQTGESITVNPLTTTTFSVIASTDEGCTGSATITVIVDSVLNITLSSTTSSCGVDDGTATVNLGGSGYTYYWDTDPPQNTQTATGLGEGTYSVTVTYTGCVGYGSIFVDKEPPPTAAFYTKPDYVVLFESPVFFYDQSTGYITNWYWDFGDGSNAYGQNAMHEYADTGSYPIMLIVSEPSGCKDTAYATVHVNPYFAFWIPNSFTPNDDDRNEIFIPQGNGYDTQDYFMVIYDRWGREIFYTKDVNEGWNGTYENKYDYTKCVQGTYVYLIRVKDLAGIKHIYKGIVTLIQ